MDGWMDGWMVKLHGWEWLCILSLGYVPIETRVRGRWAKEPKIVMSRGRSFT